jgi:hypothetical protein
MHFPTLIGLAAAFCTTPAGNRNDSLLSLRNLTRSFASIPSAIGLADELSDDRSVAATLCLSVTTITFAQGTGAEPEELRAAAEPSQHPGKQNQAKPSQAAGLWVANTPVDPHRDQGRMAGRVPVAKEQSDRVRPTSSSSDIRLKSLHHPSGALPPEEREPKASQDHHRRRQADRQHVPDVVSSNALAGRVGWFFNRMFLRRWR